MNRREAFKAVIATMSAAALPAATPPNRVPRALQDLRTHGGARLIDGKWRLNPIVKWDYSWAGQWWVVSIFDGACCICDCTKRTPCFVSGKTQVEVGELVAKLKRVWNRHCPENPIEVT